MIICVSTVEPSREELLALVAELTVLLELANARVQELEAEVAALRSRLGKDSTNSSQPPSADSPAARAKRKVVRSQRVRCKDRKRGGQPGHPGAGLSPTEEPDRTERVAAPEACARCGGGLADGVDEDDLWAQVWDIAPVVWEKVHYLLARRRCRCCGLLNTATAPGAQPGSVSYGPNLNAAAILLGHEGNVPVAATAAVLDQLMHAAVSTGFVARSHQRLSQRLATAGFDQAMVAALRAQPVLCVDETSANVVANLDPDGNPAKGQAQVVTVRTPDERLVYYAAVTARSGEQLKALGILDGWTGHLVRDDYAGYQQFDATLAGVQQCVAHLHRHLAGVAELDSDNQLWASQVQKALRDAAKLVDQAKANGTTVAPDALAEARKRYDQGVLVGISANLSRPWHKGNHPGLVLARRLQKKADQVWLFTHNLDVPATNNAAERALRGPARHEKVSGYWQSTHTLDQFCRVRSYLASAVNHGMRAIDAIHAALNGRPWLPKPAPT